jgi:hypothetical protein
MARPQVADGGVGLQIWRVAANILNKQSRTADNGWSTSLGFGREANNSSPQKISFLLKITRSLGPGRNSSDKRPKRKKMNMIFGTWNVIL